MVEPAEISALDRMLGGGYMVSYPGSFLAVDDPAFWQLGA
jgi:hypothetical protein